MVRQFEDIKEEFRDLSVKVDGQKETIYNLFKSGRWCF